MSMTTMYRTKLIITGVFCFTFLMTGVLFSMMGTTQPDIHALTSITSSEIGLTLTGRAFLLSFFSIIGEFDLDH